MRWEVFRLISIKTVLSYLFTHDTLCWRMKVWAWFGVKITCKDFARNNILVVKVCQHFSTWKGRFCSLKCNSNCLSPGPAHTLRVLCLRLTWIIHWQWISWEQMPYPNITFPEIFMSCLLRLCFKSMHTNRSAFKIQSITATPATYSHLILDIFFFENSYLTFKMTERIHGKMPCFLPKRSATNGQYMLDCWLAWEYYNFI